MVRWKQFSWCVAIAVTAFGVPHGLASAQGYSPRGYVPRTPTVSPYLNLLRRDRGELSNYYTFVRPQQRAQQFVRDQYQMNNQLQRQVQGIRNQAFRAQGVRQTGIGGSYLNYLHFYPGATGR